jgi:hypothetical protein
LERTTKLLADTIALVGTKDTLAYAQVAAAQTWEDPTRAPEPYTAADEYAMQAQLEQERQVEAAVNAALGGFGVVGGYSSAPTYEPSAADHAALGFGVVG